MQYLHSLQSEWLKTRRSIASWLCLIGGFFIPLIYMIIFIKTQSSINQGPDGVNVWMLHFKQLWQNMAVFLLPMGLIMASSLITQVEYRNNTWKQLHTTPQSFTNIFAAKFSVVLLMTLKFFAFFNLGIFITGFVPCWIFDHAMPKSPVPWGYFLQENLRFFVTCLPIMAIQFLLSMQFRNFLVPIGVGFLGLVGTLIGAQWKYIVVSPYSYCPLKALPFHSPFNLLALSSFYFLMLTGISYWLYRSKKEKG